MFNDLGVFVFSSISREVAPKTYAIEVSHVWIHCLHSCPLHFVLFCGLKYKAGDNTWGGEPMS